ncbi:MAG TPA: hypothetical protein VGL56_05070 [Fimbriimonadaceae bacterium]|jgi:hypothetical protein
MRFLVIASMPTDKVNKAMKHGTFGPTMEKFISEIKPEAAYFTEVEGIRTGMFIVNLTSSNEIMKVSEPLFHAFEATIKWHAVMSPEEVMSGAHFIEAAVKNYT